MEEIKLNEEEGKIRDYIFKQDWRPQRRAAAIVRLERLERAVAKHEEILSRINALLDLAAQQKNS